MMKLKKIKKNQLKKLKDKIIYKKKTMAIPFFSYEE